MSGVKVCSKCATDRRLDEFNADPRTRDGHRPECGTCQREAARAAYRRRVSAEGIVADLRGAQTAATPRGTS